MELLIHVVSGYGKAVELAPGQSLPAMFAFMDDLTVVQQSADAAVEVLGRLERLMRLARMDLKAGKSRSAMVRQGVVDNMHRSETLGMMELAAGAHHIGQLGLVEPCSSQGPEEWMPVVSGNWEPVDGGLVFGLIDILSLGIDIFSPLLCWTPSRVIVRRYLTSGREEEDARTENRGFPSRNGEWIGLVTLQRQAALVRTENRSSRAATLPAASAHLPMASLNTIGPIASWSPSSTHNRSRGPEREQAQEREAAVCAGCGWSIRDPFILRVSPDLEFHAACLRCAECRQRLDETRTCFVRSDRTFCRRDYLRLFGVKCSRCSLGFGSAEPAMRARGHVYHLSCFRCASCARRLLPGDECSLRPNGELACGQHGHQARHGRVAPRSSADERTTPRVSPGDLHLSDLIWRSKHSIAYLTEWARVLRCGPGKTSRVRTVLTDRQLQTLRTCYAANPRPDALLKEQLVEMTGLSPRVIRVWFQNKRCKDKKRSIAARQGMQPHEKPMNLSDTGSSSASPISDPSSLPPQLPDTPTSLASEPCSEP
uniref:insulin gene enhancer protein ISL-2B-like n=1 Tax=Myxine glutinosa TaxID=7769 RepID=UPI00358E7086